MVVKQEFDLFRFPDDYKWCLAFYKLCAIYHAVREMQYRCYAVLDTDVYVCMGFENVFKECANNILLYDINEGLQVESYSLFLQQINSYCAGEKTITRFGGEFFAASRENAHSFSDTCLNIFNDMLARGYRTDFGDEFITALAAEKHKNNVKNAGGYIFRFWTGAFRLVSTCYKYNPVSVFHVPDEKSRGMVALYDRYISKGKIPGENELYRCLHLKHRALSVSIRMFAKKIINYGKT